MGANGARQVRRPTVVDLRDKLIDAETFPRRFFFQQRPENRFQRYAGAMTGQRHRSFDRARHGGLRAG